MKRSPSLQDVTWFLDLYNSQRLVLDPPYQRKSVWSLKDRRFFLDTIFRNYPAPPIFIHKETNNAGVTSYNVVDGKQRLETIINFSLSKIALSKDYGDENLNGKKFKDIPVEYKKVFWNYVLVVDFIEVIQGENIDQVFDRVNRNSITLLPQELRHARFNGWFITEAENEAIDDFWWDIKVSTRSKHKRMKNIQNIAELLAIILDQKIVGFDQEYLDSIHAKYNFDLSDEIDNEEVTFDHDEYISERNRTKSYITSMHQHNPEVLTYLKTSNNLYILWALVALNKNLPSPSELADKYVAFMVKVNESTEIDNDVDRKELDTNVSIYQLNSSGASTDATQRNARLHALSQAILTAAS